jgi:hypothetical protein
MLALNPYPTSPLPQMLTALSIIVQIWKYLKHRPTATSGFIGLSHFFAFQGSNLSIPSSSF